jgi:hypothetical protein
MFRRARARLTFANVISLVALFVALGGTGYAALKLPNNSVGTKQLKSSAVTTSKIHAGAVTGSKLACQRNGGLVGEISIDQAQTLAPTLQPIPNVGSSGGWNCSGQTIRVARVSAGQYVVTFPGAAPDHAVVTSHDATTLATVGGASGDPASTDPQLTYGFRVSTTAPAGGAKDGDFTLAAFTKHNP